MLICQTGYEKFKDKLDNKWKCKKGQLLKNQEASYEKEKEEGIKKYQVIKDFYKISDTKSIICIEEIEKSNQSEQFNYFVFSEKESAGYKLG